MPSQRNKRWSDEERARERELFREMGSEGVSESRKREIRDEIVTNHLALVEHMARRFRDRGEQHDDLVQVGMIGLINAVDRFDPEREVEFSTFATPTIIGEIKRHFRDRGWSIRVPRRLQEIRLKLTHATAELSQKNGRSPTVAELAQAIGVTEEEVLEGLESAQAYATLSLDASSSDDDEGQGQSISAKLGRDDAEMANVEIRESLKPALDRLSPRERQIIVLRFFENKTQTEIAQEVGISQMQVSRLLTKTLARMRRSFDDD